MTDCDHVTLDKDIEREALERQALRYVESARQYRLAEDNSSWYWKGKFYTLEEAQNLDREPGTVPVPKKYSATEDLMFVYSELAKIYRRIFELETDL